MNGIPKQQIVTQGDTVLVFSINAKVEPKTVKDYKEFTYAKNEDDEYKVLPSQGTMAYFGGCEYNIEYAKVESIAEHYIPDDNPYIEYCKQSFYVIEPRLEKIVSTKYKEKIESLEEKVVEAQEDYTEALERVIKYNQLPWYKKIFKFII